MTAEDQFHRFTLLGPNHTVIRWPQLDLLDGRVVVLDRSGNIIERPAAAPWLTMGVTMDFNA
ncbi:MAG: hypothetical protein ACRDQ4_03280 [Pseudonocardiaceae bacterium]